MAELAIVENVQRKDLNALEKAASFQRYIQEYGCTQEELASRVNVDRSTVANLIRLLELPEQVKQLVAAGEISQGHARALLPLGDEDEQKMFAKRIAAESLSVRATEQLVSEHIQRADGEPLKVFSGEGTSSPSSVSVGGHLSQLEDQLRLALGTKVELRQSAKGKGKITIHFGNLDEFDRIKGILTGESTMFREVG
jgi:ParB family chromosome partitioning protein